MSDFYSRTGDDGYTGLLGEGRVEKNHPRMEAVGAVDEASAAFGAARINCLSKDNAGIILEIQRDLYHLMAEIAATRENASRFRKIDNQCISWLENKIEEISKNVDIPKEFIVPGDSPSGAFLALARTIVRRAERRTSILFHDQELQNPALLAYLNRLSSLCFILELKENQLYGSSLTLAKE